jgi:hypothetical protein
MSQTVPTPQDVARRSRGPQAAPEQVWAPLTAGVLTFIPGLLGLLAGQPWLFPSLAPTAYLQAARPQEPAARFYNTVVGHLVGLAAAYLRPAAVGRTTSERAGPTRARLGPRRRARPRQLRPQPRRHQ